MGIDILAFWSLIALVIRTIAIVIFIILAVIQFRELQRPPTGLRPLARLLFSFFLVIIITSAPLLYLNYIRIQGHNASPTITSFATVTNAIGLLAASIMLLLIYLYRGDESDE